MEGRRGSFTTGSLSPETSSTCFMVMVMDINVSELSVSELGAAVPVTVSVGEARSLAMTGGAGGKGENSCRC